MKSSKTKDELIAQLKALAHKEVEIPEHWGAMCYSPQPPSPVVLTCEMCGKKMQTLDWDNKKEEIEKLVQQIVSLGYEATITMVCSDCAKRQFKNDDNISLHNEPYYIFSFKPKDEIKWHKAIANEIFDYQVVLAFLRNREDVKDSNDHITPLKDHMDIISRMTGISIKE